MFSFGFYSLGKKVQNRATGLSSSAAGIQLQLGWGKAAQIAHRLQDTECDSRGKQMETQCFLWSLHISEANLNISLTNHQAQFSKFIFHSQSIQNIHLKPPSTRGVPTSSPKGTFQRDLIMFNFTSSDLNVADYWHQTEQSLLLPLIPVNSFFNSRRNFAGKENMQIHIEELTRSCPPK